MNAWIGTTNIVHLSEEFQQYTWSAWNTTIGKGAPYTNAPGEKGYGSTHTTTWSLGQLRTKYPNFDIDHFLTQSSFIHKTNTIETKEHTVQVCKPIEKQIDCTYLYKKKLIDLEIKYKKELLDLEGLHKKEMLELELKTNMKMKE
jgi:hypothetical protein